MICLFISLRKELKVILMLTNEADSKLRNVNTPFESMINNLISLKLKIQLNDSKVALKCAMLTKYPKHAQSGQSLHSK